ncbi:hypothetical protein [Streptomyces sp. NBC_01013]|uniref:hypothetical protein n=1 Tax=Streptomyces sp. NBC_01013 TaxID=2903718 RepID=UPI00386664D8|nr:hypothetical protein OG538_35955 [Streptomyces sp. NBC_01013]
MFWLSGSKVGGLLRQIGRDERPVTHDTLDELPASKVLAHLRSVLVATGALPPRDERLVALDQWITSALQARTDLTERRILHGYAVWHHLRRLRRRLGQEHTTHLGAERTLPRHRSSELPRLAVRQRSHAGHVHPG